MTDTNASLTKNYLTVGKIEGYSYLALLFIAMPLKYLADIPTSAVSTTPNLKSLSLAMPVPPVKKPIMINFPNNAHKTYLLSSLEQGLGITKSSPVV